MPNSCGMMKNKLHVSGTPWLIMDVQIVQRDLEGTYT